MMSTRPTKYDDVIDSREIIEAIEEIESEIEELETEIEDKDERLTELDDIEENEEQEWTIALSEERVALERGKEEAQQGIETLREELRPFKELAEEAAGYAPDWEYGETLIRDSYFETYAQELAEDIGAINKDAQWPNSCIDWEQAARELQMDYTCVSFDGVEYWIR